MNVLRRLLWLVRHPLPFPVQGFRLACAVFGTIAIGAWFGASDLLTLKIAVATGLTASVLPGLKPRLRDSDPHLAPAASYRRGATIVFVFAVIAAIVMMGGRSVTIVQHFITAYYLMDAAIGLGLFLITQNDPHLRLAYGRPSAIAALSYQMVILTALCLALLNVAFAQHLSPIGWLIAYAMTPLILHPFRVWTMIAMWPHEDRTSD